MNPLMVRSQEPRGKTENSGIVCFVPRAAGHWLLTEGWRGRKKGQRGDVYRKIQPINTSCLFKSPLA
ncbi:hypothetical protein E2C01_077922 [Portunus trituberculatus]|uniref:Uncharacterized protein n=1 Tax=Portunus trituberculatus TaxID=210409 RepID=A0A5B7IFP0_PORTR|nr:hypothetical protein [Portunus trituberculatus]